jgi:hypothetical protein
MWEWVHEIAKGLLIALIIWSLCMFGTFLLVWLALSYKVDAPNRYEPETRIEMSEQQVQVINLNVVAAKAAHEANRVYCEYIGDDSQVAWDDAPKWQRESAIMGVEVIKENPDITPAQQHSMWMAHKTNEGWVYGEVKDEDEKTHPCMVPYNELPLEQKFKDALFQAIVRSVLTTVPQ